MSKYITYFEKNWIFSSSSPLSLSGCYAATLNGDPRTNNASEGATTRSNKQQLRTILASGSSCKLSGHSTLRWSRSFYSSGRTSILSAPINLELRMQFVFIFIVHSVAVKLNYSTCKRNVSRAVRIPSSGDFGHQGTESPLHEIWSF